MASVLEVWRAGQAPSPGRRGRGQGGGDAAASARPVCGECASHSRAAGEEDRDGVRGSTPAVRLPRPALKDMQQVGMG